MKAVSSLLPRGLALACLIVCQASQASPQVITGTILGTVTDPSNHPVPNSAVIVRNIGTNARSTSSTSEAGEFTISLLPPGTYEVEITASGFKTFRQSNVQLTVDSKFRVDARLQLGEVTQTVDVQASLQGLQTDSTDVSTIITQELVEHIPSFL